MSATTIASPECLVSALLENGWVSFSWPDLLSSETWHDCFASIFNLDVNDKLAAGKYRPCQNTYVGFKQDEVREFIECHRLSDGSATPDFPITSSLNGQQYSLVVATLFETLSKLAILILTLISERLGLHPNQLLELTDLLSSGVLPPTPRKATSDPAYAIADSELQQMLSSSVLRICRYESKTVAEVASRIIRFGSHTDTSFLTIASHSVTPGLEILDLRTRDWVCPETAYADCNVTVLAGELLQVMTRHRVKAAIHRVVSFESRARISCPFIIRGNAGAVINYSNYQGQFSGDSNNSVPDLNGMRIGLVQKLLDLKRAKYAREHSTAGNEDWILCSYPKLYTTT